MTKNEIVKELREMARSRMFGDAGAWPVSAEECLWFNERFIEMGLIERVDEKTTRKTALADVVKLDLAKMFIGLWDFTEGPGILLENGFIDEAGYDVLCDTMIEAEEKGGDPWPVLRPVVEAAYLEFASSALH